MKTTKQLLILLAVISLMACKKMAKEISTGEELPITIYSNQVHVITLYVNTSDIVKTDSIEKNGMIIKPGLRKYADFRQPANITNEEFTTIVRKGDLVIWKGVSTTDSLDVVNITSINHQGGDKLFGKNVLRGNGDDPEVVVGIVKRGPNEEGEDKHLKEKYKLKFKVMNNGVRRNGTFIIDPVLKAY